MWARTSKRTPITRLICAPAGDFRMLLMCWSRSVSFENLTAGAGGLKITGAGGACAGEALCDGLGFEVAAMLLRIDWQFSCCLLNFSNLSCSAIWKIQITKHVRFTTETKNRKKPYWNPLPIETHRIRQFSKENFWNKKPNSNLLPIDQLSIWKWSKWLIVCQSDLSSIDQKMIPNNQ